MTIHNIESSKLPMKQLEAGATLRPWVVEPQPRKETCKIGRLCSGEYYPQDSQGNVIARPIDPKFSPGDIIVPSEEWVDGEWPCLFYDLQIETRQKVSQEPASTMPEHLAPFKIKILGLESVKRVQEVTEEEMAQCGVNRISHAKEGYFFSAFRTEASGSNWCFAEDAYRELLRIPYRNKNPWLWLYKVEVVKNES